ncbi:MAG: hAT transposon family protein, partial [Gammaproteobacteria bacterium]|nr:hAT transposon family protein [Gammaproteobacteria bacterium]
TVSQEGNVHRLNVHHRKDLIKIYVHTHIQKDAAEQLPATRGKSATARLKAQIDAYVEVVQNQTAADQPGLCFWKCNRDKYNRIVQCALNFLALPATTIAVERLVLFGWDLYKWTALHGGASIVRKRSLDSIISV